jgi:hypothetical protein
VLQLPSQAPHMKADISSQVPSGHVEMQVDELKKLEEEQLVQVVEVVVHF